MTAKTAPVRNPIIQPMIVARNPVAEQHGHRLGPGREADNERPEGQQDQEELEPVEENPAPTTSAMTPSRNPSSDMLSRLQLAFGAGMMPFRRPCRLHPTPPVQGPQDAWTPSDAGADAGNEGQRPPLTPG